MPECESTFDGEHHWAKRHWLARREDGSSYDQTVLDHWAWVWACHCGVEAPSDLIEELTALAAEARKINAAQFGAEQGEQGRLL
ncbi:hypothetical protein LCGC14_1788280 [marine sediment metagenome]|uniref:Uncharacterized protein n=1 Tax=marine sediment metagenome TaxID=412755 RepID=A0A0F9GTD9_9ZZZZ